MQPGSDTLYGSSAAYGSTFAYGFIRLHGSITYYGSIIIFGSAMAWCMAMVALKWQNMLALLFPIIPKFSLISLAKVRVPPEMYQVPSLCHNETRMS